MTIIRKAPLKSATPIDYLLIYLLAGVAGAFLGWLLALRLASALYEEDLRVSLEYAQKQSVINAWGCVAAGVLIAWLYVTVDLIRTRFRDRREAREKQQREEMKNRLRGTWIE